MRQTGPGGLDSYSERLRALADELQRERGAPSVGAQGEGHTQPVSLDGLADALIQQRKTRKRFLPGSLFHEPAWEILLNLYVAHRRGAPLNVKHLVSLVDAPVTTSQRWIDQLVHMKLLNRVVDVQDRRRLEISLAPTAVQAMEQYLRSLAPIETVPPQPQSF